MKILIKNILHDGEVKDVLIENNFFKKIGLSNQNIQVDKVIDGEDKVILPAFYNLHTHAAMNLLRGYSEDLPLFDWLNRIWKKEDTLTEKDIYNGTLLAILEMIHSGTVFFADMYWHHPSVIQAVKDMGIRADVGLTFMDKIGEEKIRENIRFLENFSDSSQRITVSPAPHAIYTCSSNIYKLCKDVARANGLYMQTHLSETSNEVDNCLKEHSMTPVQYLDALGVLDEKTIAAHLVHLTEGDARILSSTKTVVVHNPCSNMKLASGVIDIELIKRNNITLTLGTDGCSSNNNLSMIEEMKFASLLAKVHSRKADVITAQEIYDAATINGAKAYGINAGKIEEGMLADCILVDLNNERMQPNYNTIYNMVYSADSACIDTLICNGDILMENHHVKNEEDIIAIAKKYNEKK